MPGLDVGTIVTVWGPLGLGVVVVGFVAWKLLQRLLGSYDDRLKDSRDAIVSYNQFSVVTATLADATERQNALIEKQGQQIEKLIERMATLERVKP